MLKMERVLDNALTRFVDDICYVGENARRRGAFRGAMYTGKYVHEDVRARILNNVRQPT